MSVKRLDGGCEPKDDVVDVENAPGNDDFWAESSAMASRLAWPRSPSGLFQRTEFQLTNAQFLLFISRPAAHLYLIYLCCAHSIKEKPIHTSQRSIASAVLACCVQALFTVSVRTSL